MKEFFLKAVKKLFKRKTKKKISENIVSAQKDYKGVFSEMEAGEKEKLEKILEKLAETENNDYGHIGAVNAFAISCLATIVAICTGVCQLSLTINEAEKNLLIANDLAKIVFVEFLLLGIVVIIEIVVIALFNNKYGGKLLKKRDRYLYAYCALLLSQSEGETKHEAEKKGDD